MNENNEFMDSVIDESEDFESSSEGIQNKG
jgi:hypothetical protein